MGMGIVNDKDFESEKSKLIREDSTSSPKPIPSSIHPIVPINPNKIEAEIKDSPNGRGTSNVGVPNTLRQIIGEESAINGRQSGIKLAESFGISPSSVSAYAEGATSTASYHDGPNRSHIDGAKIKVASKARKKLTLALSLITRDKLENSKARDLAGIAKDMAVVMKQMEPEKAEAASPLNGPTFIFYTPPPIPKQSLDVIYTKE